MRTFFRYVSLAELEDLRNVGQFRAGPNGAEGKWFTNSSMLAKEWGDRLAAFEEFDNPGCVISFEVPEEDANSFHHYQELDGIGPAWFATFDQLSNVKVILPPRREEGS